MELKSEPAYTETHVTDWEFATIGGTRAFTLEDGVDSCEYVHSELYEGGLPHYRVYESRTKEWTTIFIGPTLIGHTQRPRIRKSPVTREETK